MRLAQGQRTRDLDQVHQGHLGERFVMMSKNWPRLLLIAFASTGVLCSSVNAQEAGWHSSLEAAELAAEREGTPLLIHFHAWYCGPCRQMDSQVFHQRDVQEALMQDLHAVQIDVTHDPDAASRYQATTVPRDVVVYPDGTTETLNVGFVPRARYVSMLRRVASRGLAMREEAVPLPSDRSTAIAQAEDSDVDDGPRAVTASDDTSTHERVLGLEGYCPVALTEGRKWIEGQAEISTTFRGVTYYFADAESRKKFDQDPRKFAPQNLGCDPVLLFRDQRAISGRIQYGAFFDGSLFLFTNDETRSRFKKNPLRYTKIRHAIRIDEVEGRRVL